MALARRQALLAQTSAASAPASKRKRAASPSHPSESALPPELEQLIPIFGQIEAIMERYASWGSLPTVDAVAEGAGLKPDVIVKVVGMIPTLYRIERRASDSQLCIARLVIASPAPDPMEIAAPAWRQREARLNSRRQAFIAALSHHWTTHHSVQLPTIPLPPPVVAPKPPAATLASYKRSQKVLQAGASAPHVNERTVPDELRGLSLALIGRIRAREAAQTEQATKVAPVSNEATVLAALPRLAEALRALFTSAATTGKVSSLPTAQLVPQLQTALALPSKDIVCEQLLALTRVLPGWASLVMVAQERGDPIEYLRIDRNVPFPDVKRKLAECRQSDRAPMKM